MKIYEDASIQHVDASITKKIKGPKTYGEANPALVSALIRKLNLQPNDVFFDVGSGTPPIPPLHVMV